MENRVNNEKNIGGPSHNLQEFQVEDLHLLHRVTDTCREISIKIAYPI